MQKTKQQTLVEEWREKVKNLQEFELFIAIESIIETTRINTKMSKEMLWENKLRLNISRSMLRKFGIDESIVGPKSDYWRWSQHWKKWIKSFDKDTFKQFEESYSNKQPIDQFLPKKKWNE